MKFEVGQRAYSERPWYKDIIVLEVKENRIKCSLQTFEQKYSEKSWKDDVKWFDDFELRATPFQQTDSLHEKSKWDNIIQRNPNVVMSLRRVLEDLRSGDIYIPEYQRELVWTLKQKQKYIMNLFLEKAVITPTFILNMKDETMEIIDGSQRIRSLKEFVEGEFALENEMYFGDLNQSDCSFILNHKVRYTDIRKCNGSDLTLEQKIELFLEINELGTKMAEEHIEKVKKMIR
jgi:hypothetical protein